MCIRDRFGRMIGKVISGHKGSVSLSGDLLGGRIDHTVDFEIPNQIQEDCQSVSTIHHLAGKRLIKEMEMKADDGGKGKEEEIVKLSCDSSVISKFTAFIAIDEEQKEPVKGSLQTWDVQAPQELSVRSGMAFGKAKKKGSRGGLGVKLGKAFTSSRRAERNLQSTRYSSDSNQSSSLSEDLYEDDAAENFAININQRPAIAEAQTCLLYTSPSPRDRQKSRMPSSA